ncbi:DEAD/DEAH box helicase family protein [Dehalococcoides mccartyi]|nr:DEAD/DEAH box helicase family protein [Dehalococcoides mccartyi]
MARSQVETPVYTDSAMAIWAGDPVRFTSETLGANPWSKQVEILEAIRDNVRVAVRSCNGSGKTYIAAHVVLWWLMCHTDAIVITTAPTAHQVRNILWREIRRAYHQNSGVIGGTLLRTSLELGDKHYAQGLSTDTPERFQGFHEGHILFVVDEASGVREGIFEAIEGSMTSAGAKVLLLGNPTSLKGTFYDAFHKRRGLWKTIHISAFDTPNLVKNEVVLPMLVTPKWVADAETNWGTESYLYQVRVMGEFPSESEDTLIPLKMVERAAAKDAGCDGSSGVVEVGVDVARFGSDRTAICVRRGEEIVSLDSFGSLDTMNTAGRVANVARKYSPAAIRIDEIGIGAGVVDRLTELKIPNIEGVNVARRASKPEQFANLRAELFDGLRDRFISERMKIPNDADLISQLASIKYLFTSSGQMRIEGKDELRSRGERSPDLADSVMLAFARSTKSGFRFWAGPESEVSELDHSDI